VLNNIKNKISAITKTQKKAEDCQYIDPIANYNDIISEIENSKESIDLANLDYSIIEELENKKTF